MNLSDIGILRNINADYRCIISWVSISEAISLMKNIDLTEKKEHYKKFLKMNIKSNF